MDLRLLLKKIIYFAKHLVIEARKFKKASQLSFCVSIYKAWTGKTGKIEKITTFCYFHIPNIQFNSKGS